MSSRTAALRGTGVRALHPVHANLTAAGLTALAMERKEGRLSADGALIVHTGVHTGRSAQDKFVVEEPDSAPDVWWGAVNRKLAPQKFATLTGRVQAYLQGQELFTQDLYAGADDRHRIKVRLVTTQAWSALFARNMFIRPSEAEFDDFEPDYVILHAPHFHADPAIDGVRSSTVVALSFGERRVVIAGTEYAGEIKKSIFTIMNWRLPARGVLPMHCSANVGADQDVALFFGLSGTGKTTLSSDPARPLIGDDEHGWGAEGVFNFEGGCYAKVINLSQEAEPEIWAATHRFGTVLENVVSDHRGRLHLDDDSLTENTRSCYPVDYIPNCIGSGIGGHPRNVVMLAADAFGVMPAIARLSPAQAMYHFLSGYTAIVAGTEKGAGSEPTATFSACFGAPFLPRRPEVYARLLAERLALHGANCWLINTGWAGGPYGIGSRIPIRHTRALLRGAIDGSLAEVAFRPDAVFGLMVPESVPGVPVALLNPRLGWNDPAHYDAVARGLVARFAENFAQFEAHAGADVTAVALRPS